MESPFRKIGKSMTSTEQAEWISCGLILPKNGEVVETKIDDSDGLRNVQKLKRQNNLWFHPSGNMYVYYKPTHWRVIK